MRPGHVTSITRGLSWEKDAENINRSNCIDNINCVPFEQVIVRVYHGLYNNNTDRISRVVMNMEQLNYMI